MSEFENETEKKVREIIKDSIEKIKPVNNSEEEADKIMLRIRPYLKVQKKWIGDAL